METPRTPDMKFRPGRHFEIFDGAIQDPYQLREKFSEPTVCTGCGAVFHDGHWQWLLAPENAERKVCPACLRMKDDLPAGYVTIQGNFAMAEAEEILRLIHNHEHYKKKEHPLQRIMHIDRQPDKILITTTDIHLARGIGEALEDAYKGKLDFHYSDDEYLLRVNWER